MNAMNCGVFMSRSVYCIETLFPGANSVWVYDIFVNGFGLHEIRSAKAKVESDSAVRILSDRKLRWVGEASSFLPVTKLRVGARRTAGRDYVRRNRQPFRHSYSNVINSSGCVRGPSMQVIAAIARMTRRSHTSAQYGRLLGGPSVRF